jgi:hypothetical protein
MHRVLMKLALRCVSWEEVSEDDTFGATAAAEETLKAAKEALRKSEEILAASRRLEAVV